MAVLAEGREYVMKPTRILILLSMVLLALTLFIPAAAAEPRAMVVASGTAVGDTGTQEPPTMHFKIRAFAPGSGTLWLHAEGATDWAGTHAAEVLAVETAPAGPDPGVGWTGEVLFRFTESSIPDWEYIGDVGLLVAYDSWPGPKGLLWFADPELPLMPAFWQVTTCHIVIR